MASAKNVFKALSKMTDKTVTSSIGASIGATRTIGQIGVGVINDAYKLAHTLFKSTGSTYKESIGRGQLIPFKLKHGIGAAGFILASTYNISDQVSEGANNSVDRIERGDFEQTEIPNTLNALRSPRIDTMGADGKLVLAAHNGR